ncbi:type-1 angiotensin II receptor B-like [Montipora foliosa]|uniref:type-1 angiotensin II receptor B-like n=1 Tax=Montipora foliosa TaxID=591990 RepID=UPI0035F15414
MESENVNGEQTFNSASPEIRIALITTVFVVSFIILAGNLLTVVSILCFTKRKSTFSFLLVTISLIDILNILGPNVVSLFVFFDKGNNFYKYFTLCRLQAWSIVFLRCAATLAITLLGLDRFFITLTPRFYRKQWKGKLFVAFFFGKWIISAFIATWPLLWLDGFHVSKDTGYTFCLFLYENPVAGFFVVFLMCLLLVSCLCFYAIFSTSNKGSFSTKLRKDDGFSFSAKQREVSHLADPTDNKDLTILAALVVAVYFCCLLPWMIAITLGTLSVDYPSLFGLCALQLPLVSSLLNPLIYGIRWLPYRRAYHRALRWPCTKCCNRKFQKSSRSRSHNFNCTTSAGHSFWISDGFVEADADHENAFHVLFSSTSYIKPLDFNLDELEMFEQNSRYTNMAPLSISNGQKPITMKDTTWRAGGNHFQNILDFIEAKTGGNHISRNNKCANEADIPSAETRQNHTSAYTRSVHKREPAVPGHASDLELSLFGQNTSDIPSVERCDKHKHSATCSCLGKSKYYPVERKNCEMESLMPDAIENLTSRDALPTDVHL